MNDHSMTTKSEVKMDEAKPNELPTQSNQDVSCPFLLDCTDAYRLCSTCARNRRRSHYEPLQPAYPIYPDYHYNFYPPWTITWSNTGGNYGN